MTNSKFSRLRNISDIKPYVPDFDVRETKRIGWFAKNVSEVNHVRADDRFQ